MMMITLHARVMQDLIPKLVTRSLITNKLTSINVQSMSL